MATETSLLGVSISRNSIILGLFAIATTGLIVLTEVNTRAPIKEARDQALASALHEVLPKATHDNELLEDAVLVQPDPLLGTREPAVAYIGRENGNPNAVILQVTAPEGYGGSINLLVAILADGTVSGVRVVPPHPETPGLGDAIEITKSDWILGFNGRSLNNPPEKQWKVKKDGGVFDAFTGATITPRAVVDAVYNALKYFEQNRLNLFGHPAVTDPAGSDNP
ncbi:MAG: electron transport complex subunit RsxG [Ketobacteraceae bacterium]|nr:electron transport complex subunit RsxG [Ketobacteraceae bacterium]